MTQSARQGDLRVEFERLLGPAGRRVHFAAVRVHLARAVPRALAVAALLACGFCVLRFASAAAGRVAPIGWAVYFGLIIGALVVVPIVAGIRCWMRELSLGPVAERLDLATANHNRTANAMALIEAEASTPFARAAVADGLKHLRRLHVERPHTERAIVDGRRVAVLGIAFVAITVFAGVCGHPWSTASGPEGPVAAGAEAGDPGNPVHDGTEPRDDDREAARPAARDSTPRLAAAGVAARTDEPDRRPEGNPAAGRTGTGRSAEAAASNRSAAARGQSGGASARSQATASKSRPPSKQPKPSQSKNARVVSKEDKTKQEDSTGISQGASGGGTMSLVQHGWRQRARTAEGEQDEPEEEGEVEEDSESSTQRGGIQPSLKDRGEAPSRELGISGEEGKPGTGRGGPTPPKKSRGTASLVLGVPLPDFVKGRLGPGTTKVTHERVEPSPMPGEATTGVSASGRSEAEDVHRAFDIPHDVARVVRDYLIALHARDREEPEPAGPAGNTRSSQE